MQCKINSYFRGTINGIVFRNENNYMATSNILYTIEEKYKKFYDRQALVRIVRDAYTLCAVYGIAVEEFEDTCVKNINRGSYKFLPKSLPQFKEMNATIEQIFCHDVEE